MDEHRPARDSPEDPIAQTDPGAADAVRFGRTGLDDAPTPIRRSWLILSAGLALAVGATAVLVGTGIVSTNDVDSDDPDVAEFTETTDSLPGPDLAGISHLTRATGTCLGIIRDQRNADSTGGLGIAPAAADLSVVYEYQTEDYAAVAVTDGGLSAVCASSEAGLSTTSYDDTKAPKLLRQHLRAPTVSAEVVTELLVGEVGDSVEHVEVVADGERLGTAHVAGGYFSALVNIEAGSELEYVVTAGGEKSTLRADQFATSELANRSTDAALACLSYLNITVAEPEPYGNRSEVDFDGDYELIAEHNQSRYVLAAATDGDTVTACLEAPATTWIAEQPDRLPPDGLIAPLRTGQVSSSESAPVVGRAAASVTAVDVITADGQRIETHLEDGFYAALIPREDAAELTYVVREAGGESTVPEQD